MEISKFLDFLRVHRVTQCNMLQSNIGYLFYGYSIAGIGLTMYCTSNYQQINALAIYDTTTCMWLDDKDTHVWRYTLPIRKAFRHPSYISLEISEAVNQLLN